MPGNTKSARRPAKKNAPRPVRKQPETLRLSSITPSLTVNDLLRSIGWYRDVLGFKVQEEWKHNGQVMGAELKAGTVSVMLGQDDFAKGRDRKKGEGFRLYCTTRQDIDQLADLIKARGGVLEQEPADQPWGARDFTVVDPDGFKITITTSL
ncbi:MAG: VOC family protein [Gemmatimonadetes bacterium]|nr:VOC family protein [Gemmatimonadota bacterium]